MRLVQRLAAEHRVEALDGRDDHLGVLVQPGGAQVLGDVDVGELLSRARRIELLKLLERLRAEIRPVHEEQHTSGTGMLEQPHENEQAVRSCPHPSPSGSAPADRLARATAPAA